MSKLNLPPLAAGFRSANRLNENFAAIETALENTLSRDGTTPNDMEADLDLNSNRVINLAEPVDPNDAVRLADLQPVLDVLEQATDAATAAEAAQTAAEAAEVAAELAETNAEAAEVAAEAARDAAIAAMATKLDITGANVGGSAATLRTNIGADLATNVNYTAPGSSPLVRPVSGVLNDVIRLADYNAGTGGDATAALAAAITDATARGIGRIVVRGGHYVLTNAPVSVNNLIIEGDGDTTRFTVGANNSNLLAVSGSNVTLKGMRLEGDSTANSTSTGLGVLLTGGGFVAEDVLFDTMGMGCLKGTTTTDARGPKLIRIRGRNNGAGASGFPAEIFLNGAFQSTLLEDVDLVTAYTRYGLLLAESGTSFWQHCEVRGGWFEGMTNYGVAATDEGYTGLDRVHGLDVTGGYYRNCVQGALKAKQCKSIKVRSIETDGCGGTPENAAAGLRGTVIMHGVGPMTVEGCTLRGNGSSGIQVSIPYDATKMFPNGTGMPSVKIVNNHIDGSGLVAATYGDSISCTGPTKDLTISGNTGRNFSRYGIYHETGSMKTRVLHLTDNTIHDAGAAGTRGMQILDVWSVQQNGNSIFNVGTDGAYFDRCDNVQIGTTDRSGDSSSYGNYCYAFIGVPSIQFNGSASCYEYAGHATTTAYTVGQRIYNGDNVYECTVAGTSAGATPPTGTGTAITDGTVTWCYVHKRRFNAGGLYFGAGVTRCVVGASALFENLVGPWATGTIPSVLRRANQYSNSDTMSAGEVTFNLPWAEPDNNYVVHIDANGAASEVFRAPDADKGTSSFKVKSSDGASTAFVRVSVSR